MPALSPIPVFDLNAVKMIAAKIRSMTENNPDTMVRLHDCDFGVMPFSAFRQMSATPVAPNVQWVLAITPCDKKRPSLLFGLFIQNNQISSAGWIKHGAAPTPAEVAWWNDRLAPLAQALADVSHVAPPNWNDDGKRWTCFH